MPLFKQSQLTQRNKLIELFQDNPRIRESIQMILNKIGYEDTPGMVRLLGIRRRFGVGAMGLYIG